MKLSPGNNLAAKRPDLAAEWDYEANGGLRPEDVTPGSRKKVGWICGEGHRWLATVANRSSGSGCPECAGKRVGADNNLAVKRPDLAAEWDYEANGDLRPEDVTAMSGKKVGWICAEGHRWLATVDNRSNGSGCPECTGQRAGTDNNLAVKRPDLAAGWDYEANGDLRPEDVTAMSNKKVWWRCGEGHRWEARINNRSNGRGCPECSGRRAGPDNNLAVRRPDLATEWDREANGGLRPEDATPGSNKKVGWICGEGHRWLAAVANRSQGSGCPECLSSWTPRRVKAFVASLPSHIDDLDEVSRFIMLRQAGLLSSSAGQRLLDRIREKNLRSVPDDLPEETTDTHDDGDPLGVTLPVQDEPAELPDEPTCGGGESNGSGGHGDGGFIPTELTDPLEVELPVLPIQDEIKERGALAGMCADEESMEQIVSRAVISLWNRQIDGERAADAAREIINSLDASAYEKEIATRFVDEHNAAISLQVPSGWAFRPPGQTEVVEPSLMQRRMATMLRDRRRVGNWSGTGSGKTVSAILGAAVSGCQTVLVVCPNATVDVWRSVILSCFPQSEVEVKTTHPRWRRARAQMRWLVLNYESLSRIKNEEDLEHLVGMGMDLLVVDEVHFAKYRADARGNDAESARRQTLKALVTRNPDLRVIAMSATPVLNHLSEAVSLLELVSGEDLSDVNTKATVNNAMDINARLMNVGIRHLPRYGACLSDRVISISCPEVEDDLRGSVAAAKKHRSAIHPLVFEQAFLPAKLDSVVTECLVAAGNNERVFVYTQYVDGIVEPTKEALEAAGLRVGVYTGGDKSGLSRFLGIDRTGKRERRMPESERVDVLIGSSAIGTGVDGLQLATRKVVFLTLPWTAAEYQQVIGRVYRQGMGGDVEVIVPRTYLPGAAADGSDWSWDQRRWNLLHRKQSLADAAVDGVIPGYLSLSPAEVVKAGVRWLGRIDTDGVAESDRVRLRNVFLPRTLEQPGERETARRRGRFGQINLSWNRSRSTTTHARLTTDPSEWNEYHDLYRQAREHWEVIPAHVFAEWLDDRGSGRVVADLGCGEMLLAERCTTPHDIRGFDHVAMDDRVVACDISRVPVDTGSVDIAVLSLALMGSNHEEYVQEAHRILRIDGQLWMAEPISRIGTDRDRIQATLEERGFGVFHFSVEDRFVLLSAMRLPGEVKSEESSPLLVTEKLEQLT